MNKGLRLESLTPFAFPELFECVRKNDLMNKGLRRMIFFEVIKDLRREKGRPNE